jgi:hypothetical protein
MPQTRRRGQGARGQGRADGNFARRRFATVASIVSNGWKAVARHRHLSDGDAPRGDARLRPEMKNAANRATSRLMAIVCESATGPSADRRRGPLIGLLRVGPRFGAALQRDRAPADLGLAVDANCAPMRIVIRDQGAPQRALRRERKSRDGPAGFLCARQQDQPARTKGGDNEMTRRNDPPRINSPLSPMPNWTLRSLH